MFSFKSIIEFFENAGDKVRVTKTEAAPEAPADDKPKSPAFNEIEWGNLMRRLDRQTWGRSTADNAAQAPAKTPTVQ